MPVTFLTDSVSSLFLNVSTNQKSVLLCDTKAMNELVYNECVLLRGGVGVPGSRQERDMVYLTQSIHSLSPNFS